MSFSMALRLYLLYLFFGTVALVILMPKELKLDVEQSPLCSILAPIRSSCKQVLSRFKDKPFVVTRPTISFTMFGQRIERTWDFTFGLDIAGGTLLTLRPLLDQIPPPERENALESASQILNHRLNLAKLPDHQITSGSGAQGPVLFVSTPQQVNREKLIALVSTTANVEFREYVESSPSATPIATSSAVSQEYLTKDFVPTTLTGADLRKTTVQLSQDDQRPVLALEFTEVGTEKFADLTKRSIGKPLAVFLDEYPISAPKVEAAITNGQAHITGEFSLEQAKSLVSLLNAGPLPVPLQVTEHIVVDPTLGRESLIKILRAGVFAVGALIILLIGLYRFRGLLVSITLLYSLLIVFALAKLLPLSFTVPGLAGFFLGIGILVDTSILFLERLTEEEYSLQRPFASLLRVASRRVFSSIRDANILSLFIAAILANPLDWTFLPIHPALRGFAGFLALGILVNIFFALPLTTILLRLFYKKAYDSI